MIDGLKTNPVTHKSNQGKHQLQHRHDQILNSSLYV
jgi:hypothetical protein